MSTFNRFWPSYCRDALDERFVGNRAVIAEDTSDLRFTRCGSAGWYLATFFRTGTVTTEKCVLIKLEEPTRMEGEYEYAGFVYVIHSCPDVLHRIVYSAIPKDGQHPAAGKMKHRRAAVKEYLANKRPDRAPSGRE